jgi:hypothetical protein
LVERPASANSSVPTAFGRSDRRRQFARLKPTVAAYPRAALQVPVALRGRRDRKRVTAPPTESCRWSDAKLGRALLAWRCLFGANRSAPARGYPTDRRWQCCRYRRDMRRRLRSAKSKIANPKSKIRSPRPLRVAVGPNRQARSGKFRLADFVGADRFGLTDRRPHVCRCRRLRSKRPVSANSSVPIAPHPHAGTRAIGVGRFVSAVAANPLAGTRRDRRRQVCRHRRIASLELGPVFHLLGVSLCASRFDRSTPARFSNSVNETSSRTRLSCGPRRNVAVLGCKTMASKPAAGRTMA